MVEVQKIECRNMAAFVMSFKAKSAAASSESTSNYAVTQSKSIDLAAGDFQVGDVVWPEVHAVLGKTISAEDHITFQMNGKMALYEVRGTTLNYSVKFIGVVDNPVAAPPNFPAGIPVAQLPYKNWSLAIDVPSVWTATPANAVEVVDICNWAKSEGYTVRAKGIAHTWSPITIPNGLPANAKVMLINTANLKSMSMVSNAAPAQVRVGTGATMLELMTFLESQSGNGSASGFSFPNTPAPDHLSVGGVLAINGHGTSVSTPPNDAFDAGYGSMSNNIMELTAVVTDPSGPNPEEYRLKTFKRGDADTRAFLTHLGRSVIVEVVLHVIDNYNLQCESITNIKSSTLFAAQSGAAPPAQSLSAFLAHTGRVEAIWYPFTDKPWLKVWSVKPTQPAGTRVVNQPNNYPFSDNVPESITSLIKLVTGVFPSLTPKLGQLMLSVTDIGLTASNARNLWGPSKNTLFYVKDTTLRVTANGYAVLMKKDAVQNSVAAFARKYESMLKSYETDGKYPINAPLEIRVTGLDSPDSVPGGNASAPVISSLSTDGDTVANGWDVALWLDILTLPGTKYSNEFYEELEDWFLATFNSPAARVVPEWSKGWAYTKANGAWSNSNFMEHIRTTFTTNRTASDNWDYQVATLAKYDQAGLFKNELLDELFVNV